MKKNISRLDFLKGAAATGCMGALATLGFAKNASAEEETSFASTIPWNAEYDAVVVGLGGAGAIAAIDMADAGLDVVVLEKAPYGHEGGNTRYSSQRFLVVAEEDREKMMTYMKSVRGLYENMSDEVISFLVDGFTKTLPYYEKLGGTAYELKLDPEFPSFEGSDIVTKCYTMNEGGKGFWPILRAAVTEREDHIHVWYESPAQCLVQDPVSKTILGVKVQREDGEYYVRAKRGVVLACGGFEANNRMVEDYLQLPYAIPLGSPYNTGDGITMAQEAGADLWHMSALSGPFLEFQNPNTTIPFRQLMGTLSYSSLKDLSAIIVGADGTRFVEETVGLKHGHVLFHGMFIRVPLSLPAFAIFDEQARLTKPLYRVWSQGMEKELEKGWIIKADTLEELAEKISVPAEGLVGQIERYNGYCEKGVDEELGRPAEYLHAFGDGPYYALPLVPAMINTQGGPARNIECEVLDVHGNPIPRLYSAGELGSFYSSIYQGAGNLGECMVTGWKVAEKILANEEDSSVPLSGEAADFTMNAPSYEVGENEYIGVGYGMGRIVVKVKMNGEEIENISFLEINDTLGICDGAITAVPKAIVEAQSTTVVDTVSGATRTSNGILDAVNDALLKAYAKE